MTINKKKVISLLAAGGLAFQFAGFDAMAPGVKAKVSNITKPVYEDLQIPIYEKVQVGTELTKVVVGTNTKKVQVGTDMIPVYTLVNTTVMETKPVPDMYTKTEVVQIGTEEVPVYETITIPVYQDREVPVYEQKLVDTVNKTIMTGYSIEQNVTYEPDFDSIEKTKVKTR